MRMTRPSLSGEWYEPKNSAMLRSRVKSIRFVCASQVLEARQDIVVAEIRRVLPRELDPPLLGTAKV